MSSMNKKLYALLILVAVTFGAAMFSVGRTADEAVIEPSETMSVRVGMAERQMYVYVDGQHVETFRVSVGSERHPTPTGTWHIQRVIWNPSWTPPPDSDWAQGRAATAPGDPNNPMGRVKMFFRAPDYYVHGTNDEWGVGWVRSHGCVRLRNDDAIRLAQLAMEHGGEPREPNWFKRILNRVRDTHEVGLSRPIPIEVTPGTPPAPLGEAK